MYHWDIKLLNFIFLSRLFPGPWCVSRLVTIFKKGVRALCDNYRGLSIMDSLAKIYDRILCTRLEMWFKPDREQAGAQKGRSCTEWILTLRLLMDYAISRKKKLFIVFVDFSKAYDRVPRNGLISRLKELGCGICMLCAIAVMYENSQLILGSAIISVTMGVKQGSPSSCFLFTLYVNPLIRMLKERCAPDGFLGVLHCLLLMDDTVIFSTSRAGIEEKIRILQDFCTESGMIINETKTKFMVLNGDAQDRRNIVSNNLIIKICEFYVYLGAVFSASGKLFHSLEKHAEDKYCHVLKFVSFVKKNSLFPFWIKKKVLDAALLSAILYSSESWLTNNYNPVKSMYFTAIKNLLGVRRTTANDLCLLELGMPSIDGYVKNSQYRFLKRLIETRANETDFDPFMYVYNLCLRDNTACAKYISKLLAQDGNFITKDMDNIRSRVRDSNRSKFLSYKDMNPNLNVNCFYLNQSVNELDRINASRIRLSSHNLAIETGRWSRVLRENRLCKCGNVQTESHVLIDCTHTEHLRLTYSNLEFRDVGTLFDSRDIDVCKYASKCLKVFK